MQNSSTEPSADAEKTMQIDMYTREIEEIADMLDALKEELERKEQLLLKVEETLEDTEKVLEDKIQSIVEKDEKLKNIEEILKRKEEDMRIQEEELQTNAALEYLSFRAREEDISGKMTELTDKEQLITTNLSFEELTNQIQEREELLRDLEQRIKEGETTESLQTGQVDPKILEEMEAREKELRARVDEVKEVEGRLMEMEHELRDKERELFDRTQKFQEQQAAGGTGSGVDPQIVEKLQAKEKEVINFKKQLEEMDIKLKERDEELKFRENELEKEHQKLVEQMGMDKGELAKLMANEQEMKYQIEREKKQIEREITEKIQRKSELRIQPLLKKIELLSKRNEELEVMDGDLERKHAELEMREMQLRERFEELSYSEEKLSKREERILSDRMDLEEERKKIQSTGHGGDLELMEEEIRLKNEELRQLEERLEERESFLREKEVEMKRMESQIIEKDLDMEIAVEKEKDVTKIKTGVRRLDDLLFGGLPLNSNVFVYGPPFTGKLVLLNLFIAEGLRKGVPGVFILTDKSPSEIRDGLKQVLPKVDVYEKKGLLRYIDAYSRGMGIDSEETNTTYIEKPTDLDELGMAVTNVQDMIAKEHKYHKVAFHSVSTIMAYTDAMTTFRFLQTLTSRNKRAGAVSQYCMDYGMFSDSEVQTLKHLMNGILEFKVDDLKSYLRVEGISDVRTRGWIEYTHTTKNLSLKGSFAVDHIR
jgi:KaiC/GvpD/RAD55 family RecA-like ATPase